MSKELECYKRLKACRTALKGSATRKLQKLSELVKHEYLDKDAFQQSNLSLQQTLNDFRTTLKLVTELCFNLPENELDKAEKDVEANELALENCEAQAIEMKCEFDATILNCEKLAANVDTNAAPPIPESKPKFKPRDLLVPKWNGDLAILSAWKQQIIILS